MRKVILRRFLGRKIPGLVSEPDNTVTNRNIHLTLSKMCGPIKENDRSLAANSNTGLDEIIRGDMFETNDCFIVALHQDVRIVSHCT